MRTGRRLSALASVAVAVVLVAAHAASAGPAGRAYDVSWPQCGTSLPSRADAAIIGVNGGRPYDENPCLAGQYRWATGTARQIGFYLNTSNPGTASRTVDWYRQSGPRDCSESDEEGCAYNFGYNGARYAFALAQAKTGAAGRHSWWLDVETTNTWSGNHGLNVADIKGTIDFLRAQNVPVGVYSTDYQWRRITGGARFPELPNWMAGANDGDQAARWCSAESSFTGGPVVMIQWVEHDLDHNALCSSLPEVEPGGASAPNALDQLLRDVVALDLGRVLVDLGLAPPPPS